VQGARSRQMGSPFGRSQDSLALLLSKEPHDEVPGRGKLLSGCCPLWAATPVLPCPSLLQVLF
jgi:hypothetical protein